MVGAEVDAHGAQSSSLPPTRRTPGRLRSAHGRRLGDDGGRRASRWVAALVAALGGSRWGAGRGARSGRPPPPSASSASTGRRRRGSSPPPPTSGPSGASWHAGPHALLHHDAGRVPGDGRPAAARAPDADSGRSSPTSPAPPGLAQLRRWTPRAALVPAQVAGRRPACSTRTWSSTCSWPAPSTDPCRNTVDETFVRRRRPLAARRRERGQGGRPLRHARRSGPGSASPIVARPRRPDDGAGRPVPGRQPRRAHHGGPGRHRLRRAAARRTGLVEDPRRRHHATALRLELQLACSQEEAAAVTFGVDQHRPARRATTPASPAWSSRSTRTPSTRWSTTRGSCATS